MADILVPLDFVAECAVALPAAEQREALQRTLANWVRGAADETVRSTISDVFDRPSGEVLPFVLTEGRRAVADSVLAAFLSTNKGGKALVFSDLSLADAGFWAVSLRKSKYHELGPAAESHALLLLNRPEGHNAVPQQHAFDGGALIQREKKGFALTITVSADWLENCAPHCDPKQLQLLVLADGPSDEPAWTEPDIFAKPKVESGPGKQVVLTFGTYRPETIIRLSALGAAGAWVGLCNGPARLALLAAQLRPLDERVGLPTIVGRPWRDYRFVNWLQRLQLPRVPIRRNDVPAMLESGGWPAELLNQTTLSDFVRSGQ